MRLNSGTDRPQFKRSAFPLPSLAEICVLALSRVLERLLRSGFPYLSDFSIAIEEFVDFFCAISLLCFLHFLLVSFLNLILIFFLFNLFFIVVLQHARRYPYSHPRAYGSVSFNDHKAGTIHRCCHFSRCGWSFYPVTRSLVVEFKFLFVYNTESSLFPSNRAKETARYHCSDTRTTCRSHIQHPICWD